MSTVSRPWPSAFGFRHPLSFRHSDFGPRHSLAPSPHAVGRVMRQGSRASSSLPRRRGAGRFSVSLSATVPQQSQSLSQLPPLLILAASPFRRPPFRRLGQGVPGGTNGKDLRLHVASPCRLSRFVSSGDRTRTRTCLPGPGRSRRPERWGGISSARFRLPRGRGPR